MDPDRSASDEAVRELAREILARPEYAVWREAPSALQKLTASVSDWLRGIRDWIPDWLADAWDRFVTSIPEILGDGGLTTAGRLLFMAVVLGLLAALVIAATRAMRESMGDVEPLAAGGAARSRELIEEAAGLAREGRFLEAAHTTQLAALQVLLRAGWVELERSDPNRTLRRRVREGRLPEAERGDLLRLLDRLESSWFRDRVEDRDLYTRWRGLHARLAALAPRS